MYDLPTLPEHQYHELAALAVCNWGAEEHRSFVLRHLEAEDFTEPTLRQSFEATSSAYQDGEKWRCGSLPSAILRRFESDEKTWPEVDITLMSLMADDLPDVNQTQHYVAEVKRARHRRILADASGAAHGRASRGDDLDDVLGKLRESIELIESATLDEDDDSFAELIEVALAGGANLETTPTGIPGLDALTLGLGAGQLWVVAGRTGMGKSILGLQLARHTAFNRARGVAFYSLEMSGSEITRRVLAAEASVSLTKIRTGGMDAAELQRVTDSGRRVAGYDLWLKHKVTHVEDIIADARERDRIFGVGLVVVDYLQLVTTRQRFDNRVAELAYITRQFKTYALDMGVPVVALAQLNRKVDERSSKRPILSDLRESGSIEQDADVVLFIYREGAYQADDTNTSAELIVAKQRDGATGHVYCDFQGQYMRFREDDYMQNIRRPAA